MASARPSIDGEIVVLSSLLRELSLNLGDRRGQGGSGLSLRFDDLNSVGEPYITPYYTDDISPIPGEVAVKL